MEEHKLETKRVKLFCEALGIRKNSKSLSDYEYLKNKYFNNCEHLPQFETFCKIVADYLGV